MQCFSLEQVAALAPGKTAAVNMSLPAHVLALVDKEGTSSVQPGDYKLRVGGDALGGGCDAGPDGQDTCARMNLTLRGDGLVLFSMAEVERRHTLKTDALLGGATLLKY